jgi:hypothetical protein
MSKECISATVDGDTSPLARALDTCQICYASGANTRIDSNLRWACPWIAGAPIHIVINPINATRPHIPVGAQVIRARQTRSWCRRGSWRRCWRRSGGASVFNIETISAAVDGNTSPLPSAPKVNQGSCPASAHSRSDSNLLGAFARIFVAAPVHIMIVPIGATTAHVPVCR